MRPIVSFMQSPTYQLSKHISDLLSPLVSRSSSAVRNSKEFTKFIASQMLSDDEVLVSFDVVSLFTNVPTDLAISVARERLEDDEMLEERTGLEVDDITRLLKMCLDATYLTFRDTHYQQTFGTATGSPVSVTVANLVMEEIESEALVKLKDPVPVECCMGIVYQIPCKDCSQTYVGQSGRTITDRIKEHQQVVKNGDTNTSAVAENAWKHQHRMDWSASEVLDYSQHRFSRCMLDSWHIHHLSDSMNQERGPLPVLYCSL